MVSGFSVCVVGLRVLLWGKVDSLGPFLPFVELQCLAARKGNVFAFKIRGRRKKVC